MAPITNRVNFSDLVIATNNFAFEVKAILGMENTHLEICVAKTGFNGPYD